MKFSPRKNTSTNQRQGYPAILFISNQIHRRYAGIPDFLTADDMDAMVRDNRIDPKMVFSYVQEVYRMCNEM